MTQPDKSMQNYEKIQTILYELKAGKDRNTVAKSLGYSNPKSLDIYMRRKGFTYDSKTTSYIPLSTDAVADSRTFTKDNRITTILSMFSHENPEPRRIAEITGFNNHIELAEFMKSNHFEWNDTVSNYTRIKIADADEGSNSPSFDASEFYIYLPLLQKLYEHKDALYALLEATDKSASGTPFVMNPKSIELTLPEDLTTLIHKFLENKK